MTFKTKIEVRTVQLELAGRESMLLRSAATELNSSIFQFASISRSTTAKSSGTNLLSINEPWVAILKNAFSSALRAYLLLVHKRNPAKISISAYMSLGLPPNKPLPTLRKKSPLMLTAVYYVQPWTPRNDGQLSEAAANLSPDEDIDINEEDEDTDLAPRISRGGLHSIPSHGSENVMVIFEGQWSEQLAPKLDLPYEVVTCQFVINQRADGTKAMTKYIKYTI